MCIFFNFDEKKISEHSVFKEYTKLSEFTIEYYTKKKTIIDIDKYNDILIIKIKKILFSKNVKYKFIYRHI